MKDDLELSFLRNTHIIHPHRLQVEIVCIVPRCEQKVDIPSYRVKPGDVVGIRENSREHGGIEIALANVKSRVDYISYDEKKKQATYVRYPQRSELNAEINESLIVEYYSRV